MSKFDYETIVVGAGQAGLAAGYYLKRAGLDFTILDANEEIGAAWDRRWDSLRLFTPARYDALPGLKFPGEPYALPGKADVAAYLRLYARSFSLPVQRGVAVTSLHRRAGRFVAATSDGRSLTAASVAARAVRTAPSSLPVVSCRPSADQVMATIGRICS